MLGNSPIITNIPAVDLNRAVQFYTDVLGLSVVFQADSEEPFALLEAGQGTRLFIYQRSATTADHTVFAFIVEDIDAAVDALAAQGVVFEHYDSPNGPLTDERGIARMETGAAAWFKDTEGNILSVGVLE